MSRRFGLIVFVLAYLFSHIWAGSVYSADPQPGTTTPEQNAVLIDNKIADLEKRFEKRLETNFKEIDNKFSIAEGKFEKRSEQHFVTMKGLFDATKESFATLVKTAGWLLGVIAVIAAFLFVNQGKNIKDMIDKRVEDAKQRVSDGVSNLEQETNLLKQELRNKLKEVEKLKAELDSALKPLLAYKDKKVVWAYEDENMDDKSEIGYIRGKDFQVSVCKPGEANALPPDKCDLMIYSFCKSDKSVERLEEIIGFLKSAGREVPLIIYTYNSGNSKTLLEPEKLALKDYPNHVMANMPLTLKSQFNSLIRL